MDGGRHEERLETYLYVRVIAKSRNVADGLAQTPVARRHLTVLIILSLYILMVWLLFSKLKLISWGWVSGTIVVLGGAAILAVFLALFNHLTPSGSFTVVSRVTEITPNVSGQVMDVTVKPNQAVKVGTVLFRIDPAPFQYKVQNLEASLAQARQQVKQLKATYEQAGANVQGLVKESAYLTQRLADMTKLTTEQAMSLFRQQDTQVQYETTQAQLLAARAAQENAKLAMDSEIGGVNTTVAKIEAQLADAKWELDQTTVRAPGDGVVTLLALTTGDRALQARSVMSFIAANEIMLVGMFAANGFETVKPGVAVKLVFHDRPGRIYKSTIVEIPHGVGQGQVAVSGTLARSGSITGAAAYPATIAIPDDLDRAQLRVGMPGNATAFAENAGVVGLLMSILVWISSYTAYL
jgi:multidrug resistance efflux pump